MSASATVRPAVPPSVPSTLPANGRALATGPSLLPTRDDLVDAGCLLVVGALALYGFKASFGGLGFLAVGMSAMVVGVLLGYVALKTRQPLLVTGVVVVVAAVLLAAGIALRDTAVAGVLPSLGTVRALGSAAIDGWKQLLTTVRPVGTAGDLLALPYLLGLGLGVLGYKLARQGRFLAGPAVPVFGVAALSILFGAPAPTAAFVQGALLTGAVLAWLAVRQSRVSSAQVRTSGRGARTLTGLVMLGLLVPAAWVVGPHLPGTGAHQRVVLRVDPPFDPGQYPSPLAGFRKYVPDTPVSVNKETLFTVKGAPAGTPLRIATMDLYDGVVWGAGNGADERGDLPAYAKVGSTLPTTETGPTTAVTVTPSRTWHDVWLPTAGEVSSVDFSGADARAVHEQLRFSLATEAAVVPGGVPAEPYTLVTRLRPAPKLSTLSDAQPATSPTLAAQVAEALRPVADKLSGSAASPMGKVLALAAVLKNGRYSNGADAVPSDPGHGLGRMLTFLQGKQLVGDDEQYAAAMALLADVEGVPARVVLGALVPGSGTVTGDDVTAWVELDLLGRGWTPVLPSEFMPSRDAKPDPQPRAAPQNPPPAVVPPPLSKPLTRAVSAGQADTSSRDQTRQKTETAARRQVWLGLLVKGVALPIGVPLLVVGLIVGLKAGRRRLRRTRGGAARRIAAGWAELLDAAADRGTPAVRVGTRREQARGLSAPPYLRAATTADALVFGPGELDDQAAHAYWQAVRQALVELDEGAHPWTRFRYAVSLRSLRPSSRFAPGGIS